VGKFIPGGKYRWGQDSYDADGSKMAPYKYQRKQKPYQGPERWEKKQTIRKGYRNLEKKRLRSNTGGWGTIERELVSRTAAQMLEGSPRKEGNIVPAKTAKGGAQLR